MMLCGDHSAIIGRTVESRQPIESIEARIIANLARSWKPKFHVRFATILENRGSSLAVENPAVQIPLLQVEG